MTRRALFGLAALPLLAQDADDGLVKELNTDNPDTILAIIPEGKDGIFCVGVRSKIIADLVSVRVFYWDIRSIWDNSTVPPSKPLKLLLSEQSLGPLAGWEVLAATDKPFSMKPELIAWIEVMFLNMVERRQTPHVK